MNFKGAFVLFPVVLTIILADCVGGGGGAQVKDCGVDMSCFYAAVSVCEPAKIIAPYEDLSLYLETRQATDQCELFVKVLSGPASASGFINTEMLCAIPSNWANLTFSEDYLGTCRGTLADELKNYLYHNQPTACSDGTAYGVCSSTKPQYCDGGVLINKCTSCGCASGQSCNQTSNTCYVPVTPQTCSDGTTYGQCSATEPKYCSNGVLTDSCLTCGCPTSQSCNQTTNACYVPVNPQTCSDGTIYGQCSVTKPKYCNNGVLTDSCSACGCLSGQSCNQTSNACYVPVSNPTTCSDGTLYSQCSVNKPRYCNNGVTIDSCSTCGCPTGLTCNQSNYGCYYPQANQQSYRYEERILLNGISAIYDESTSAAFTGHGLYLNASYGKGALEFRLQFTDPLPVGSGRSYATDPAINLLGKTVRIDYKSAVNQSLYIYVGTPTTMLIGDQVTTADGYKVHLDSITQSSGNIYYAVYTATDSNGITQTSSFLPSGSDYSFFANKVSVRVEYVSSSTAITTVTSSKQILTDGAAFPLDSGWTVKHVDVSGGTTNGYLNYIALKYGDVSNPPMFLGSVQTGLAAGTYINGPDMADGTPKYQMRLGIFPGSTSRVIDSTGLMVNGAGSDPSNHILKLSWPARDGSTQTLDAALPTYVVIPTSTATTASFNTNTNARWMIVNDKVIYLKSIEPTGTGTQYQIRLAVGGSTGQEVVVGPFANANGATSTFTYASNVDPIQCTVTLGHPEGIDLTNVTLTASGTTSTTDTTTPMCDIYPDSVPFGLSTQMASGTGTPYMILLSIQGRASTPNKANVLFSNGWLSLPVLSLIEPGGGRATVIYDSNASDGLTGLKVYKDLVGTMGSDGISYDTTGKLTWVDQSASATLYENNLYDMTPFSTMIDGSTKGTAYFAIPEAKRNAIFEISKDSTSYLVELNALTSGINHFQTAVSSLTITPDTLSTILQRFTTNVTAA